MKKVVCILLLLNATVYGQSHVIANYSFSSVTCADSAICFTDLSSSNNGLLTNWTWIWGDGSTTCCTIQNPCHHYFSPGTYPVELIAVNSNGDSGTVYHSITVNPLPTITCKATPDTITSSGITALTSTASGGTSLYTYTWSPYNSISCMNCANTAADPTVTTCYTVSVADTNGCKSSCNVCVIVNSTTDIKNHENNTELMNNPAAELRGIMLPEQT